MIKRIKQILNNKYYPAVICSDCGNKFGKRECGVSTWYQKVCDVCGDEKQCTEPRDFGHLSETKMRKFIAEDLLNSEEFYNLMQLYRNAPVEYQDAVIQSFEDVKKYILDIF